MPICRNCGSRIDKFNKDRCPICGAENPFEGVTSETVEITTSIDVDAKDYHPRKRKTLLIFFITLTFSGVPFFYIYKGKIGFASIIGSVIYYLAAFLIGKFTSLGYLYALLIFVGAALIRNIIIGLMYYFLPNLKDGRGDFLI